MQLTSHTSHEECVEYHLCIYSIYQYLVSKLACYLVMMCYFVQVLFRFEQLDYTIHEAGVSQMVCVLLVMGSIQPPIQISVTVASGITGTATGKETLQQYIASHAHPLNFFY